MVYINIFHDIIFSYYLTATQTLIFVHIKWTPVVALTRSFLDIVLVSISGKVWAKKTPQKMQNEF